MKYLYKTPEIKVEELAKVDVLCASNEIVETIMTAKVDVMNKQLFFLRKSGAQRPHFLCTETTAHTHPKSWKFSKSWGVAAIGLCR